MPASLLRLLPVALVAALFSASEGQARGGIMLITHGETIKKIGDLPAAAAEAARSNLGVDVAVGYKFSQFGIFWLNLWTWGGEYCLFHDNTVYGDVSEADIGEILGKPVTELGKPFGYRFPLGLVVIAVAVVGFGVLSRFSSGGEDDKQVKQVMALFEDPRYQRALEIIQESPDTVEDGGFSLAVDHLMSQGVPKTEAQENLAVMIQILVQHAENS